MATATKTKNDLMIYDSRGVPVYEISLKTLRRALEGVLIVVRTKHWYTKNLDDEIKSLSI
jgi:hypothetical protein